MLLDSTQCLDRCHWSVGILNATIRAIKLLVSNDLLVCQYWQVLSRRNDQTQRSRGSEGWLTLLDTTNPPTIFSPTRASFPCIVLFAWILRMPLVNTDGGSDHTLGYDAPASMAAQPRACRLHKEVQPPTLLWYTISARIDATLSLIEFPSTWLLYGWRG